MSIIEYTYNVMFNSSWKPEGALAHKPHTCTTEVTLQEIPNMDKGIQSLNITHNRDFNFYFK